MQTSPPITLFIADDHHFVRAGIKTLLNDSGIEVVGEASTGIELEQSLINNQSPLDVLLLDLNMPHLDPLDFIKKLKSVRPTINVLAITGAPDARKIEALMRLGLHGCLLKTASGDLIEPIRIVARGDFYLSSDAQRLLQDFQRREQGPNS